MLRAGVDHSPWYAILAIGIGLTAMASVIPADATDPPAEPEEGETTAGEPDAGGDSGAVADAIHPDAVSPFLKRTYSTKPKKLWKALLEELPAAGYPPEEVEQDRRTVRTAFVDFDQANYVQPVADLPPRFGGGYTILQMLKVKSGKASIEAIVAPIEGGAELKLRARLLVQGLDRKRGIRVLTDRRSSGVIEAEFLARLESRQGLKRLPD